MDYIWLLSTKLHLYTDAAGSLGYGAIFGAHWFFGQWPYSWLGRNIIVLEMFPIVISVSIWASELANKCILFHTHNQGLVEVINRKTTKDRQLLVLLCELVLQCLKHNILFQAIHMPGVLNVKADAYRSYDLTGHAIQVPRPGYGHGSCPNASASPSSTTELASVTRHLLSASLSTVLVIICRLGTGLFR